VLGSAEESVDSAPTHQTLLDELEAAAKTVDTGVTKWGVVVPDGEAMTSKAATNIGTTARESSFTRLLGSIPSIYPPRTLIMDFNFVSVS